MGGSWEALGELLGRLRGLLRVLEGSWGPLERLLGGSWGALGPSCGSTSEHELFKKGHDRFLIVFVAKT